MKGQIKISAVLASWIVLWNTRYWWENLPQLPELLINIGLLIAMVIFVVVALFNSFAQKTVLEQYFQTRKDSSLVQDGIKEKSSILKTVNIALIFTTAIMGYLHPLGLVNWEWLEPETILTARYESTAGCTTTLRLRKGYRFKKTVVCFGVEHWEGSYQMEGDTLKFSYDDCKGSPQVNDFALYFQKKDCFSNNKILLYYPNGNNRSIQMAILNHPRAEQ